MNKTWNVTLSILLVVSVLLNIFTLGVIHKETASSFEEWLDELEQQYAENHFWCLKGRINEITVLSFNLEVPDEVLQERLDYIVRYQNFERVNDTNHYIADFKFVIPDSSTVGELCNILRSQVNDYIVNLVR